MNAKETVIELIKLLNEHPYGIDRVVLMRKLHIASESTFFRVIGRARKIGQVRIECDDKKYTIVNAETTNDPITHVLPTDDELIALLTMHRIIDSMTNKSLGDAFGPLKKRCEAILKLKVKSPDSWAERIKILDIHYRKIEDGVFGAIVTSLARKTALRCTYTDAAGVIKDRTISSQHLVRYRDNWYCDAWCHDRNALRIFSLDSITNIRHVNIAWHECDNEECRGLLATSYGIFSGSPSNTAIIRLSGRAARYAQRESWHPEQKLTLCDDLTVILEIPYSKPHELIREILSWSDEAEVVEPLTLREEMKGRIMRMHSVYSEPGREEKDDNDTDADHDND
jgi:predicted DNA-binding transcriptional regulator YafY